MTRSARLATSKSRYGGSIYEYMVDDALAGVGDHEVVTHSPRFRNALRILEIPGLIAQWYRFAKRRDATLIRTQYTSLFDYAARGITIFYHVDPSQSRPLVRLFESFVAQWFFARRRFDEPIVVIARYWRDFLEARGYRNIHLIYCGFRVEEYVVTPAEVTDFRSRYGFGDAPIVYIGNPQRKKGADLCYAALKDSGYVLVTSGVRDLDLPVRHLDLPFRDYLCLLQASEVVVTMSRFKEGWNRVAHEAMLLGTPVVGSGMGGMRELLEGGGQIVCEDASVLAACVDQAVRDRDELRTRGQKFARTFSAQRFDREWQSLLASIDGAATDQPERTDVRGESATV